MKTETVTYLKVHANRLELSEPLMMTQIGKAKYEIQSADDYENQRESLALVKSLANKTKQKTPSDNRKTADK